MSAVKLDRQRTILIGFAFLSICAFWQMYDMIVPLILRDTYGIGDSVSGVIMALDNILALFMLPLFGRLSDRCTSKMGRRTPFIALGTFAAITSLMALGLAQRHGDLVAFMICLGCLLVSMGTYRSPAVALMPDVTPKPLRSKANAVINLMGALGGVYTLIAIQLLVRTDAAGKADYMRLFLAVAAVMAIAVFVLLGRVKERALHDMLPPEEEEEGGGGKLSAPVLR